MIKANINGRIVGAASARISVFDRGFLYGDSVYEVLRTYGGAPFALGDHLDRLERSAHLIGMEGLPCTQPWLAKQLGRTLAAADHPESYIRIVITRGSGPIGLDPALARDPVILILVQPLSLPPAGYYRAGVTVQLVRSPAPAEGQPVAKSGNYLANILALREAKQVGAYEAILVDGRGRIAEGASSNLFVARGNRLFTPPASVGILEGITRKWLFQVAEELGLEAREKVVRAEDLREADECFLTSSIREVMPVVQLGQGRHRWTVGTGAPGQATRRLRNAFRRRAKREAANEWARWTSRRE